MYGVFGCGVTHHNIISRNSRPHSPSHCIPVAPSPHGLLSFLSCRFKPLFTLLCESVVVDDTERATCDLIILQACKQAMMLMICEQRPLNGCATLAGSFPSLRRLCMAARLPGPGLLDASCVRQDFFTFPVWLSLTQFHDHDTTLQVKHVDVDCDERLHRDDRGMLICFLFLCSEYEIEPFI